MMAAPRPCPRLRQLTSRCQQFMELGKSVPDYEVESRIEELVPGQCCTLIYTSGTTGPPKAAMIRCVARRSQRGGGRRGAHARGAATTTSLG